MTLNNKVTTALLDNNLQVITVNNFKPYDLLEKIHR